MDDEAVEMLLGESLSQIRAQALPLAALGATTDEIRTTLLRLDQSTEPVVLAALQSACEGYGWPSLTAYEATMAYLRLDWAYDQWQELQQWHRFLHGAPLDPEQLPAKPYPILEYLLTTSWEARGFPAIADTLAACGPARAPRAHTHDNS